MRPIQDRSVYPHILQAGDLVIWDNRCPMYRGRAYEKAKPRDSRRATTLDQSSTPH